MRFSVTDTMTSHNRAGERGGNATQFEAVNGLLSGSNFSFDSSSSSQRLWAYTLGPPESSFRGRRYDMGIKILKGSTGDPNCCKMWELLIQ